MSNELKQVALQAPDALEYHQEQTRPIHQTQEAIAPAPPTAETSRRAASAT